MKTASAATIAVFFALVSSCTVTNEIFIQDDGSGSARVEIKLHPLSVRYVDDLMESFGESSPGGNMLFDVDAIQSAFDAREGVDLVSIEPDGVDILRLEIEFDDVRSVLMDDRLEAESNDNPISFERRGSKRELDVVFTRGNFGAVTGLFILPDSPATVLVPYSDRDFLSREEYIEVSEYAFEEYLENEAMEDILKSSGIFVSVSPAGRITGVQGGQKDPDKPEIAVFFVPLLDLLTLEDDLKLGLSWR